MQYSMDKYEQRRTALQHLVTNLGKGGISAIAEKIGKDASYVSRMLYPPTKAGFKRIGEDTADALTSAYPAWLISNAMAAETRPVYIESTPPVEDQQMVHIPHYDTGGAMGHGLVLRDQPGVIKGWTVNEEWLAKNARNYSAAKNLVIVTGFGDSMRPIFQPGDPLLVDTGVIAVDFDGIYFFRVGDEGFVKRLQRIPGEGLVAISENKAYRDWTVKPDMDFQVFGRVIKAWCGEDY